MFGLFAVVTAMSAEEPKPQPTFAEFLVALERGDVHEVVMRTRDNSVRVERAGGGTYTVGYPDEYAPALVEQLRASETPFDIEPDGSGLAACCSECCCRSRCCSDSGCWCSGARQAGAAGTVPSDARQPAADDPTTSFSDVAGADEAVEELREITDFLARPTRFKAIGARIPKGVLLYGPTGRPRCWSSAPRGAQDWRPCCTGTFRLVSPAPANAWSSPCRRMPAERFLRAQHSGGSVVCDVDGAGESTSALQLASEFANAA